MGGKNILTEECENVWKVAFMISTFWYILLYISYLQFEGMFFKRVFLGWFNFNKLNTNLVYIRKVISW